MIYGQIIGYRPRARLAYPTEPAVWRILLLYEFITHVTYARMTVGPFL